MAGERATYIPPLRFRWLTRLYDPVLRLTMRDERFKARLIAQASIRADQRVLDLGCGTGTLTVMLKQACPEATVAGLDVDSEALGMARERAAARGLDIEFYEALATDPPFRPESFDCIVSSLLFHHLEPTAKRGALERAFDLLRPGGELHVADWGRPHDPLMRAAFVAVQILDGFATTRDNVRGLLPRYIQASGFTGVRETQRNRTLFGTLAFYRALKPAEFGMRYAGTLGVGCE